MLQLFEQQSAFVVQSPAIGTVGTQQPGPLPVGPHWLR
jgi:hypothetical protein